MRDVDCHPVACAEKRMKADMPNLGSKRCRLNVPPGRCFGAMEKRRWASIVLRPPAFWPMEKNGLIFRESAAEDARLKRLNVLEE